MAQKIKDKLIVQFRDKKYSTEADEEEYYRVVGFIASRHMIPSLQIQKIVPPISEKSAQSPISKLEEEISKLKEEDLVPLNPSRFELEQFIKTHPDYEYSIESITEHFLGTERPIYNKENLKRWDTALRIKVKRLTEKIAESEKGHWEGTYTEGHKKSFKFIKDNGGEAKQSSQVEDAEQQTSSNY